MSQLARLDYRERDVTPNFYTKRYWWKKNAKLFDHYEVDKGVYFKAIFLWVGEQLGREKSKEQQFLL